MSVFYLIDWIESWTLLSIEIIKTLLHFCLLASTVADKFKLVMINFPFYVSYVFCLEAYRDPLLILNRAKFYNGTSLYRSLHYLKYFIFYLASSRFSLFFDGGGILIYLMMYLWDWFSDFPNFSIFLNLSVFFFLLLDRLSQFYVYIFPLSFSFCCIFNFQVFFLVLRMFFCRFCFCFMNVILFFFLLINKW